MIRNHWYAIELTGNVRRKPLHVKRFGDNLVLWRDTRGHIQCLRDRCAHRGAALSQGRIKGDCIECPYHGFQYSGAGQCTLIPAHGCDGAIPKHVTVKSFEVREAHGLVWVWWGDTRTTLPPLPWLDDVYDGIDAHAPYDEIAQVSPVSPCRFMEANLDFGHFVFVHRTIPIAGAGPVLRDFKVDVDGDLIRVAGAMGPEKAAKKPPAKFDGAVRFPSLAAYNTPGTKGVSLVAMAPVDDHNTWFTYRVYTPPGPLLPVRRWFVDHLLLRVVFKRILHPQDLRVTARQDSFSSGLEGDLLVSRADRPIREFLTMWKTALAGQLPRQGATAVAAETALFAEKNFDGLNDLGVVQ